MSEDITIERGLEVMPGNKLIVPGCEPTSAVSSTTLARQLRCGRAIVDVSDALAAIPGSRLIFNYNFGVGPRKKLFVLPPFDQQCDPCPSEEDWYEVLRQLANEEVPETQRFNPCDVIGMGQCPSPDFDSIEEPPPSTYVPEGSNALFGQNTT